MYTAKARAAPIQDDGDDSGAVRLVSEPTLLGDKLPNSSGVLFSPGYGRRTDRGKRQGQLSRVRRQRLSSYCDFAAFLAAFLALAQRAFCASAILAFASGLRIRFLVRVTLASFSGRPGPRLMEAAPFTFAAAPSSARTS
jgi:hypothetical protein